MDLSNLELRQEQPNDYRAVEEITKEAFWNQHTPGCDEHYLVHIMREAPSFIQALSVVAIQDGKIVGNIMYTDAYVLKDNGEKCDVISFGPVSVLPEYQGKGIGKKLIENTKNLARNMGHKAIIIYGDPELYKHVGFVQAEQFDIATADNMFLVSLLACELTEGALSNCAGRFFEASVFHYDVSLAKEFDRTFALKPLEEGLPSQKRFSELVKMRKPRK